MNRGYRSQGLLPTVFQKLKNLHVFTEVVSAVIIMYHGMTPPRCCTEKLKTIW